MVANERMRQGWGAVGCQQRSDLKKNAVEEKWGERKAQLTEWMLRGSGGTGMEKEQGKGGT